MNDRPWMTALEMQFATLSCVRRLSKMPDVPVSVTDEQALAHLPVSVPFAWSSDITQAVWLASRSIPDDACFDEILPDGIQNAFWWFDWPLPLPMKHEPTGDGMDDLNTKQVCAMLISKVSHRTGFWTIACARLSTHGFPFLIESNTLPAGISLRALSDASSQHYDVQRDQYGPIPRRDLSLFRFILAASVWLHQRVITISSGHIERHRRKQIAREYSVQLPADVKVIQLRRYESEHLESNETDTEVDWTCRWIVTGHWRNQPYKNSTKLIYIMPYVKGPEDKPLKVPSHTVYAVNR